MNLLHSKFLFPERIRKGVFFLSFLFLSNYCVAATYYLVGSGGNWSDVTQWSTVACGGAAQVAGAGIYYPGQNAAGDVIFICNNKSVTLDVSPANTIASLTMQATANNTTLTFGAGQVLTVTGAVAQTGPTTNNMTNLLAVGTGTLVCGSVSMPLTAATRISEISLGTTGLITCSGNFASAGTAAEDLIVVTGNGLIQIGGNFSGNAALTAGTGTVELYSATVATTDDYAFYNLLVSGGTKSGTTSNTVSNNLNITGGTWNPGAVNLTVNGATTISGSGGYADNNNGGVNTFVGLVTLSGTGTWTSTAETSALGAGLIFQGGIRNNSTASPSFQAGAASFTTNQTIDGSGAMSFATTAYINGAFTVTNQNASTITITGTLDGTVAGSTWKNDNGSTLNYGSATVPFLTAGTLDASTCTNTVNYNRNGAQNVIGTTYCNLTLSTTAASTKTLLTSDAVVNGIFTLNTLTTFQPAALNFTANGNCSIYGTFADNNVTGTSILGDAATDNIDLSGGTINGSATGVMIINGTIQPLTGNATIGLFTINVVTPVTINAYIINFNNATGIKTFQDLVTINSGGTWTSTTISTTGNLIFQNGLTNNGTFSAGTATFNTRNQVIGGAAATSFANTVQISGAFTVTNQNTSTVNISGALDGTIAGATWKNDAGSTLNYGGATVPFATAGALDAATCSNTVNYNRNGAQNVYGTTYCNLTLSTTAASTKTLLGTTIVTGNFRLNSLTTIDPVAQNFTANGNCYIYGTFGDSNTGGTSLLGDAASDLIDLSGGTINGSATGIMTINGTIQTLTASATIGRVTITVVTPVTITSPYIITFNSNSGIKTFQDLVTVNNGATWTSTLISTTGNLIFQNGLTNNGTFTAGTATFNTRNQIISGTTAMSFANTLQINGAFTLTNQNTNTVTITGALDGTVAGSTWLNDNGSTLNYGSATVPFLTAGVLNAATCTNTINYNRNGAQNVKGTTYCNLTMATANIKTLLGATIVTGNFTLNSSVTIDPAAQNFTANGNCYIYGTFGDSNTGGTSTLGDAASDVIDLSGGTINGTATGVMTINGTVQLLTGNATIGRVTVTVVTPVTITSPYTITFNSVTGTKTFQDLVTINSGGTWNSTSIATTGTLIFQNGLSNNGSFSAGAATFNTRNQIIGGSGAMSFANTLQISGAFTVTSQNTSTVTITGALDGTVAGSTWKNDNGSTLNYSSATVPFLTAGVLNAATCVNTIDYSRTGAQNVYGTTYCNLTLSASGGSPKTLLGATIVTGNFNLNSSVSLDPVAQNFTANGNCYIYGTFSDSNVGGTSILGDAASDNIDLSGGTINGGAIGVMTINGTIQLLTGNATMGQFTINVVTPVTIISPYTITFNSDFGIKTFQGLVTINSGATWTSTSIVTTGNLILQGGLTNNGTFTAGTLRFNTANQIIGGSSAISFSNPVHINGAFTITNQNTGGINITGTLDGTVAGSIWKNDIGSTLNYGSATTMFATAGKLDVSTTTNTVNYNGSGVAQTIKVPLSSYYHLTISNPAGAAATKTLGGTIDVIGNLTISDNTIFAGSTFNITLSGNWINNSSNGTPFTNTGTVSFIGTSSQLMNGSASTTFYNVTLNNTGVSGNDLITMSIPNTVSNTLTLTDGLLVTDAVNVITLTNPSASATTAGNKTGPSFVRGPISWIGLNGAGPFIFPTGDRTSKWAPVALSNVSPATDFTCQYFKGSYSNVSTADISASATYSLNNVSKNEYWDVHRNSAAGSAAVTLYWDSASASGINSCATDGPLKVAHYNISGSGLWENANSSGTVPVTGSCSGSSGGTVTSDIMTSFSPFSFGSGGSGVNPLPIELLSFNATHNGQNVIVTWQTASEINNDYFTVERSIDGINFVVAGTEPSKALNGRSTVMLNYDLEDAAATSGTYYYRLKQTDYDGNYKYSDVVVVTVENYTSFSFDIAPNPTDGKQISIFWASQQNDNITITIHDIVGQLIYSQQLTTANRNTTPLPIHFNDELRKGIYFITVTQNENQSLNKKFVVK